MLSERSLVKDSPVIFLHIPKTAGTTLHQIIEHQYPPESVISFGQDAHQSVDEFKALSEERRAQIRMLKGHMAFGLHEYLPGNSGYHSPVYFSLMRDPVERVLSHYYYVLRNPHHYLYPYTEDGQLGLAAFLKTEIPLMLDNGQTRLISGVWEDLPFGECGTKVLETAKKNIRDYFVLVGLTERFDETLCLLRNTLGWSNAISYVPQNVAHQYPGRDSLSPETLAALVETNQLDIALYQYAEQLFEEKVQQYGPSFDLQVEMLRLQNYLKLSSDTFNSEMPEYTVTSNVPVIGNLIAWFRRNLTSHLWEAYLNPVLEKQAEFNLRILQGMSDLGEVQARLLDRLENFESMQDNN